MFSRKNVQVIYILRSSLEKSIFLTALVCLITFMLPGCGAKAGPSVQSIKNGEPFHPEESVVIRGGDYAVPDVDIPEGVEVRFEGDANMSVAGDMKLSGAISGDCRNLKFDVSGSLQLTGSLDNPCGEGKAGDIILHAETGITNPNGSAPKINTDGDLTISVGPERESWEMDIPPAVRAEEKTAPICSASTDSTLVYLPERGASVVSFTGIGIDPDGGPVRYLWSLHDGSHSNDQNPEYTFTKPGKKSLSLDVIDDEGDVCTATMTIFLLEGDSETVQPGLAIHPEALVVEQGVPLWVEINSDLLDADGAEFEWRMDDSITANKSELTFSEPGRFEIGLIARSASGEMAEAAASIFVFPAVETASGSPHDASPRKAYNCGTPNLSDVLLLGRILNGAKAKNITFSWAQPLGPSNLMIEPTANITAKNGRDGYQLVPDPNGFLVPAPAQRKNIVNGKNGEDGGNITIINYLNDIVVCGGATLTAGSGGNGQAAIADSRNESYRTAVARGGKGGNAGGILLTTANLSGRIIVQGPPDVNYNLGNGGNGGDALAYGGNGKEDCKSPTRGGNAVAEGGKGGSASYTQTGKYQSVGGAAVVLASGASGGNGGNAVALGGKGGSAIQPGGVDCTGQDCANGMDGGSASAIGGRGGTAYPRIKPGVVNKAVFKGGDGGSVRSEGGDGGIGGTCCDRASGSNGGFGGWAKESVGRSGNGGTSGSSGSSFVGINIDICGTSATTLFINGSGGNGGNGGDGVSSGGKKGIGGTGTGIPDGSVGANGGLCPPFQLNIQGIQAAFNNAKKGIELTITYTAKNWIKNMGSPVTKVVIFVGDKKHEILLKPDEVEEGKPIKVFISSEKNVEKTLRVKLIKNDIESKESKVEITAPEETAVPVAGNAPSVISLEFPKGNFQQDSVIDWKTTIPADGSDVKGWISFADPDGDASYIYFKPLAEDSNFSPFGFYLKDLPGEDFVGDASAGKVLFSIWCDGPGDHQIGATVQDEAGLWSKYFIFAFKCK